MIPEIETLIKNIKEFQVKTDETLLDLVKKEEKFVISLNVDDQLFQGKDANGDEVGPPYTAFTVRLKRKKGQPFDRVTTRDTGDFHKSFFLKFGPSHFEIDATDSKKGQLIRKYGKDIIGLTDENIDFVAAAIEDDFIDKAHEMILK